MRTVYVKFYSPHDVFGDVEGLSDKQIKESCFKAYRYSTEFDALEAYANTPCTWSTLLEDDVDTGKFIDEAYEHIKENDYDWLEENFT